jgi:hypothetical protein
LIVIILSLGGLDADSRVMPEPASWFEKTRLSGYEMVEAVGW